MIVGMKPWQENLWIAAAAIVLSVVVIMAVVGGVRIHDLWDRGQQQHTERFIWQNEDNMGRPDTWEPAAPEQWLLIGHSTPEVEWISCPPPERCSYEDGKWHGPCGNLHGEEED